MTVSQENRQLLAAAEEALKNAYAPYSGFRVGAALRTASGNTFTGCNVENASYPVGNCAERNAIAAAVRDEGPEMKIAAIAVAARDRDHEIAAAIPCGACRQAIREFGADAEVVFADSEGRIVVETIDALLPKAFSF